ncbi:MAG: putative zinc-binding metallopeptidase [Prolixibacteraceae bacterium]|nr:putative zinc-binding metallopeptidase [Prolixibacteraceae bacterium]
MKPILTIQILLIFILFGCVNNDEFTESIFIDTEELNTDSPTYEFDIWLNNNFLKPYNLSFKYKMEDVGSDMYYNLVPSSIEKSKQLAQLTKFLWFDVYAKMVDEEFLKKYGPRIIHLIGSPAYSPNSGTMKLGTAEGGIKITLFNCNSLDYSNISMLNEYFFKTMHHEFAHILHQTKMYPKEYEQISAGDYSPMGWQYISSNDAARLGFVSSYSASEAQEDFVEMIANYLVKNDSDWNNILDSAGDEGREKITKKLEICSSWMNEKWGIDIQQMRNEINKRQLQINKDFFDPNL